MSAEFEKQVFVNDLWISLLEIEYILVESNLSLIEGEHN